jgi:hypothetical protein
MLWLMPVVKICKRCPRCTRRYDEGRRHSRMFCCEARNESPFANAWVRSRTFMIPDGCPYRTEMIVLSGG